MGVEGGSGGCSGGMRRGRGGGKSGKDVDLKARGEGQGHKARTRI